ncbi:MAG: hypothetical protein WCD89_00090 [Anaerocolumna sp.]
MKENHFHTPLFEAVPQACLRYAMGASVKKELRSSISPDFHASFAAAGAAMSRSVIFYLFFHTSPLHSNCFILLLSILL